MDFPPLTYLELKNKYPEIESDLTALQETKNQSYKLAVISIFIVGFSFGMFLRGYLL